MWMSFLSGCGVQGSGSSSSPQLTELIKFSLELNVPEGRPSAGHHDHASPPLAQWLTPRKYLT